MLSDSYILRASLIACFKIGQKPLLRPFKNVEYMNIHADTYVLNRCCVIENLINIPDANGKLNVANKAIFV